MANPWLGLLAVLWIILMLCPLSQSIIHDLKISKLQIPLYFTRIGSEETSFPASNKCDEFVIPKNYKQTKLHIVPVPGSKLLTSNQPKFHSVCEPSIQNISLETTCKNDISCTYFDNSTDELVIRAEQWYEKLYLLVIYPDESEEQMTLKAEYVDDEPWYTIKGGIHEVFNTKTHCGNQTDQGCKDDLRCTLVTCQYNETKRNETVWLPMVTSINQRSQYWQLSGLTMVDHGNEPLNQISMWFVALFVFLSAIVCCFWASWYYNLRIYQNKRPPFRVPYCWPHWCFPKPDDHYNYEYDGEENMSHSFDVLDAGAGKGPSNRGTTKYRAPQFYFDDDD